jgi:lysozyme
VLRGIDVSAVQGQVDWQAVAAQGVDFAYIKCCQGNDGTDSRYLTNVQGARSAGLKVGAYHFLYPLIKLKPADQVKAFVDACGGHLDLPSAIDLEWPTQSAPVDRNTWAYWSCDAPQIRQFAVDCLEGYSMATGRAPILYTYPDFWNEIQGSCEPKFAAYSLWLASYPGQFANRTPPNGSIFPTLNPWLSATVWQHSGGGMRLPDGRAVDGDCLASWDALGLSS